MPIDISNVFFLKFLMFGLSSLIILFDLLSFMPNEMMLYFRSVHLAFN
jgi:hypothetical protein